MIIIMLILIALMLAVFWWDATRFLIPNWIVGFLLALYPFYVLLSPEPVDWLTALGIAGIAFVIGIGIFAANIMGGGDVKLLIACCLWVGLNPLLDFFIYMALLGGVIAILLLSARPAAAYIYLKFAKEGLLPQVLEQGNPIPYGLAIAGSFLILLAQGKLTGIAGL